MQAENIIETSNLSRIYRLGRVGEVRAVDGVDLKVPEAQFLVIIGPSGSGKTTLLNLLGGLDRPTSGKVVLDGLDFSEMGERGMITIRREKVGFVFQAFNLIPTLTAIENVEAALAPIGISRDERLKKSRRWLEGVGLGARTDHLPTELSAGEQQRVAVARAFVNEPKILLLDEPTGNLDTATGREIMEALRHANNDRGQTVIAVTHAGYVRPFADRILYMRDGKLYERDPGEIASEFEDE
ncbi:MAG: ABC transporter ATP-binding protein [Candidatus Bathyarchaeota archaeon]|nr:ABC transporter ATP-binding protein [Candidatus Bathyarchaeota archaeon]